MLKSFSALLLVAFNQFNWLIHDQHFSIKKEKKYSLNDGEKKLKDAKDASKSSGKPVQKQGLSRFKNFNQPNLQNRVVEFLQFEQLKIPTSTAILTEFTAQTRFNHSSIKAIWFGCCRPHRYWIFPN